MSRRRLATTLAVVLGAGVVIGGAPASAFSLSLRSHDLGVVGGMSRVVDAEVDSVVYTIDVVCLSDESTGSTVEITGVSTDEARNGAEITDFGVYALTHPMGALTTTSDDGRLADSDLYRDRTTRVERPCSLNDRDQPSSTYLAVELSRPSVAPGVMAIVDRASIHFTVDGHRHTRTLPLALGMCTLPDGIEFGTPAADGYCESDA